MVQPATVGKLINFYLKSDSEGGYILCVIFGRLNWVMTPVKTLKVLGEKACGMKKNLELKKEELIVDLFKHMLCK